jgi:hypothetical protein
MQRRTFLTSALCGVGVLTLAGCGGGGSGPAGDSASRSSGGASAPASGSGPGLGSPAGASSPAPTNITGDPASAPGPADPAPTNGNTQNPGDPAGAANVVMDTSFGVKGDGVTNDRVALQNAIDGSVGKILLISGNSRMDAAGLDLRTNSHIRFASGASIKLLAHNTASYQMLRIWDVQNVTLESSNLDGSKELNSAVNDPNDSGQGMGISIAGATTVDITSPTTINCWGDGIYIGTSYNSVTTTTSAVTIANHHATGCRRQGATITSGSAITFQNPIWENIGGTLPSAGLDIEPNDNRAVLQNIQIISPTTSNCRIGILIFLADLPGPVPKSVTIDISNHRDTAASDVAFAVNGLTLNGNVVTGHISSSSPTFVHSANGFIKSNWDNAGPSVDVTNITSLS